MRSPFLAAALQHIRVDKCIEVSGRRLLRDSRQFLVPGVGDLAGAFDFGHGEHLPDGHAPLCEHISREPIAPQRHNELVAALLELGQGQVRFAAMADHVECAGAQVFDVMGEIERSGDQGIGRLG